MSDTLTICASVVALAVIALGFYAIMKTGGKVKITLGGKTIEVGK